MSDKGTLQGKIRASASAFKGMIKQTALGGDVDYSELYVNVLEGKVDLLKANAGESVATYNSFDESYFNEISVEGDSETVTVEKGDDNISYETGVEAIINVEQFLQYLDYVSDKGTIELAFMGQSDRRLSTTLEITGGLEGWINLPGSTSILDNVPVWVTSRYDDDNHLVSSGGNTAPVSITADVREVSKIIDIVDGNPETEYYPIVTEGGDMLINVGTDRSNGVQGSLRTIDVSGPDVSNSYFEGFSEVMDTFSGKFRLQTAPDGAPLSFVDDGEDGVVLRHLCGSVAV